MKFILMGLVLIACEVLAQTAPSGYTTNYGYRKWAQGATPTADSLNQNWIDIDTDIKAVYDTAQVKMNLYGDQSTGGVKTFTKGISLTINTGYIQLPNYNATTAIARGIYADTNAVYFGRGGSVGTIDTFLTSSNYGDYVPDTAGVVSIQNTQTITGAKTFSTQASFTGMILSPLDSLDFGSGSGALSVSGKSFLLSIGGADFTITDLDVAFNGQILTIIVSKDALGRITLDHGTEIYSPTVADVVLFPGEIAQLFYYSAADLWYITNIEN